jgi:hypothetical protein
MTPDTLRHLRRRLADCELVLYADISSGTVLAADSRLVYPQENLDTISDCARAFLSAPRLASHDLTSEAVFQTPTATRVFMRARADENEALVAVCGPRTDLAHVLQEMSAALDAAAGRSAAGAANVIAFREALSK